MKVITVTYLIVLIICKTTFAQQFPCPLPDPILRYDVPSTDNYSKVEMRIYNQKTYYNSDSATKLKVEIIPVGTFYNGDYLYSPKSIAIRGYNIAGKEIMIPQQPLTNEETYISGNFESSHGDTLESQFSYGYGKYKFTFYEYDYFLASWVFANYVYIDFSDINITRYTWPVGATNSLIDMRIDYFRRDTITFQFDGHFVNDSLHYKKFWHIDLVNKDIEIWDKYGTCLPSSIPQKDSMKTDSTENGIYLNWPIDANLYNGNIGHEDPGYLNFNLEIQNNHHARINRGIPFSVNDSAKLS
ncbi:MAG TPA: hypothetical protein PKC58_17025, partial [Ignavibacteria bacterium]|nr:hypothetical protein [Ignavibacteria bacterium]